MREYGDCDRCGERTTLYEMYDERSHKTTALCEKDYRRRMRPELTGKVMPPGMKRLNARLASVELDDTLEPTDMEKYLQRRERSQEDIVIAERLARFEEKFGDDKD